jgi:CXXX repeat radical SAM target protein
MKKTNKSEELQSRREFFKKAAKGALPILAAVALAGTPNIIRAAENTPMGCQHYCSGGCYHGCYSTCQGHCDKTCDGCKGTCKNFCTHSNYGH